jgi:hypothetical protein
MKTERGWTPPLWKKHAPDMTSGRGTKCGHYKTQLSGGEELYIGEDAYRRANDTLAEWDTNKVQPAKEEGRIGIPRVGVNQSNILSPFVQPR